MVAKDVMEKRRPNYRLMAIKAAIGSEEDPVDQGYGVARCGTSGI
jgi:hypothetical protein